MDHATNYDSIMNSFLSSAIMTVEDSVEGSRWICSFVVRFVMHLLMGLCVDSRLPSSETIVVFKCWKSEGFPTNALSWFSKTLNVKLKIFSMRTFHCTKVIFDSMFMSLTQSFMILAQKFYVKISFAQNEISILGNGECHNKSHAWKCCKRSSDCQQSAKNLKQEDSLVGALNLLLEDAHNDNKIYILIHLTFLVVSPPLPIYALSSLKHSRAL